MAQRQRKLKQWMLASLGAASIGLGAPAMAANSGEIDAMDHDFSVGGLNITAPLDGNVEVGGPKTTNLTVSAPAGTFTASEQVDVDLAVFIYDKDGNVQVVSVSTDVATPNSNADGSLDPTVIDLSAVAGLDNEISASAQLVELGQETDGGSTDIAVGLGLVANDQTPDACDSADTQLVIDDSDIDEAADEVVTPDRNGPQLVEVCIQNDGDGDPESIFFIFNEAVAITGIDSDDFLFDGDDDGDFGSSIPSAAISGATLEGGGLAIKFDVDDAGLLPGVGNFIKVNDESDGGGTADSDNDEITDLAGNSTVAGAANDNANVVEIRECAAPSIASAKWVSAFGIFSGFQGDVIKVQMDRSMSSAGDAEFWNGLINDSEAALDDSDGDDITDLRVTGASIDPDDSTCILLDVTAFENAGIGNDGTGVGDDDLIEGQVVSIRVENDDDGDDDFDEPEDLLGTKFDGSQTVVIADGIQPAASIAAFVDKNCDGIIDGIKLVFGEPLGSASVTSSGITLTLQDGVTVHPVGMIDSVTGERATAETAQTEDEDEEDDVDPNQIAVTSVELTDYDFDGDGEISDSEKSNALLVCYNPFAVDYDGDGLTSEGGDDNEALPTTDDGNTVGIKIDNDNNNVVDANGAQADLEGGLDLVGGVTDGTDCAAPFLVAVNFLTGDNVSDDGDQTIIEQDGEPGDQSENNSILFVFSEDVNDSDFNPNQIRANNVVVGGDEDDAVFSDNTLLYPSAVFNAGDEIAILVNNGIEDDSFSSIAYPGTKDTPRSAEDCTAPYIIAVKTVNNDTDFVKDGVVYDNLATRVLDTDSNGFMDTILLEFNAPVDPDSVLDFSVTNVSDDNLSVTSDGTIVTIKILDDVVGGIQDLFAEVAYNGDDLESEELIATDDGEDGTIGKPVAAVGTTFGALETEQPTVDSEFLAVKTLTGKVQLPDGSDAPVGTKVFGLLARPQVISIDLEVDGVAFNVSDQESLCCVDRVLVGLESAAYLYNVGGEMFIRCEKSLDEITEEAEENGAEQAGDFGGAGVADLTNLRLSITRLEFKSSNSGITVTGNGTRVDASESTGKINVKGTVTRSWRLFSSSDGDAESWFGSSSSNWNDCPIVSRSVITSDDGSYKLHLTAPTKAFGGLNVDSSTWPVILIVETREGVRYPASGLESSIVNDDGSRLTFHALQSTDAPADKVADIDLSLVGSEVIYSGWNLLKYARMTARVAKSSDLPIVPSALQSDGKIIAGDILANSSPLAHFLFWDDNGDGKWTMVDDDDCQFDSLKIHPGQLTCAVFTLTNKGVESANAGLGGNVDGIIRGKLNSVVGGYGLGFFIGSTTGVFQFGAEFPEQEPADFFAEEDQSKLSGKENLGWLLLSNTTGKTDPADFVSGDSDSLLDFIIEFNRVGKSVDINTYPNTVSPLESLRCQAYFMHIPSE